MEKFDLIVLGAGPAGEKGAVKAAYFGYKVAIVEKSAKYGGAEAILGTLPSKTLRETAVYLSNRTVKGLFGIEKKLEREASVADFMYRKNYVRDVYSEEIHTNLEIHGVTIFHGEASLVDAHTIQVGETHLQADYILIATGSYPYHPQHIPFDNRKVHDSDTILEISRFPSSLLVIGAGVIGCEYATIFATMGTKVILVNDKTKILPFIDQEVANQLVEEMKSMGIEIMFEKTVVSVNTPSLDQDPLVVTLNTGEELQVDMILFAAGRNGQTKALKLEKLGIQVGPREEIIVDQTYHTSIANIYAVGDVIGFPALASTSMEQGRVAVAHMFKMKDIERLPSYYPFGIYTIPEVSMVGLTEEKAKKENIDYGTGKAYVTDMARGKIRGLTVGFLKLIFHRSTQQILGVHILSPLATELIHFGLLLVEEKKTLSDLINHVFNFPTLHDLYKYAAYDGLSNLSGHKIKN